MSESGAQVIDFEKAMQNQGHSSGGPPPMQRREQLPPPSPFDMDLVFRMKLNGLALAERMLSLANECGREKNGISDLVVPLRQHARAILENVIVK